MIGDASHQYYGVLPSISRSYPPVRGKLHTRYSPVCRLLLVLLPKASHDLHVLGLPLAFILSQDQTLHSKFDQCFSDSPLRVLSLGIRSPFSTSQYFKELSFFNFWIAKLKPFFELTKFSLKIFAFFLFSFPTIGIAKL